MAKQATQIAYNNRFNPMYKPIINYQGDFDYQAVADSCAIPKTSKLTEHQICWKALFSKFDMAWARF